MTDFALMMNIGTVFAGLALCDGPPRWIKVLWVATALFWWAMAVAEGMS